MGVQLYEHNQWAYEAALDYLNTTKKAAVIHPTGTGKSFIAFKLCSEYPDRKVCWLTPSEYICRTQLENWCRAGGEVPENAEFLTYARLMLMEEEEIEALNPDTIVLDEFHRCGAPMWGRGVERLLTQYPQVPVLGLSATNIRYLDDRRDMAEEIFEGHVASRMSLGEAIVRGILNPPTYVLSVYAYQKDIEQLEQRVNRAKSKAVRDKASAYLEALKRALEKAEGLEDLFDKYMKDRTGKYLVFCADVEHLTEMQTHVREWFHKVDPAPHVYTAYAEDPETDRAFAAFKADDSGHLKLLYCVDMLNEGIHVEEVSGVILLRPTASPIIYKQQIGRALSADKKKTPVIFDIVGNIESLCAIGQIEEEMTVAMDYYRSHGRGEEIVNEPFRIHGQLKDCLELFGRLNDTLSASWETMYAYAKQYYTEKGHLNIPKRYVTAEGYSLGAWLHTQRRVYGGTGKGILTGEQIQKLEAIGMVFDRPGEELWERNYAAARAYYEEQGHLQVPVNEELYRGIKLGRWIGRLRLERKQLEKQRPEKQQAENRPEEVQTGDTGKNSTSLTKDRIRALDQIGMVWDMPDHIWERNYHAACAYYEEHGNLEVPYYYVDKQGIRLGSWISNQRAARHELTEEQIQKLEAIGMIWDTRNNTAWNTAYQAACRYRQEHGDLNIPAAYISKDGCRLGRWIRHQRDRYKAGMSNSRIEKLERIGMIWEQPDAWEEKYRMAEAYYLQHGNARIPADYVTEGVWLGRWLDEQVSRMEVQETASDCKTSEGDMKLTGKAANSDTRQDNSNNKDTNKHTDKHASHGLTREQTRKLELLGLRAGTSRTDMAWEEQYREAGNYYRTYGTLSMPKNYKGTNGRNLSAWLTRQREKMRNGTLEPEKRRRLEEIGMV